MHWANYLKTDSVQISRHLKSFENKLSRLLTLQSFTSITLMYGDLSLSYIREFLFIILKRDTKYILKENNICLLNADDSRNITWSELYYCRRF